MSYEKFIEEVTEKYGDFFTETANTFFEKAVELAEDEKYEESIQIGKHAVIFANYSHLRYESIYIIGMLSDVYLANNEPEKADDLFRYGIQLLDKNNEDYEKNIDQFLDLKIRIEKELKERKKRHILSQDNIATTKNKKRDLQQFTEQITKECGVVFSVIATLFFEKAVEFAKNEKYEEALLAARHTIILANYSKLGYERVYLLGMLSQAYLDNDQLEMANEFFTLGIQLLNKNDENYDSDVDQFLDLKIIIEKELEKKKGAEREKMKQLKQIRTYLCTSQYTEDEVCIIMEALESGEITIDEFFKHSNAPRDKVFASIEHNNGKEKNEV